MKKTKIYIFLSFLSTLNIISCSSDTKSDDLSSNSILNSSNITSSQDKINSITSSSSKIETIQWDISINENGAIIAELAEFNDGYELLIFGNGDMKSYSENELLPWNKYLSKISNVLIGSGITNLGSGVLKGLNLEYIYLPETITYINANAADDNTALLAGSDILYPKGVENVYTYVTEDIYAPDKHWKSGYSTGFIVDNDYNFDTHKRYWYEDKNGDPIIRTKTKILFVGNSFTYLNGAIENSSGIPGIFDNIAESLGYKCETYSVTGPGWYLDSHANSSDNCGKQIQRLLTLCDDFDYVVLQEQSMNPFRNYNRFLNGVKALQSKVNDTQKNCQIVLYQTWGSPYSANEMGTTIAGMEKLLRDAYDNAAKECGIELVSPVGKAFTKSYYENKNIYLWNNDNRHQGYTGAYLSACVHVANIFGVDVRNTDFEGESRYGAPTLPQATYEYLREVAYQVAIEKVEVNYENSDPGVDNNGPTVSEDVIVIAGWGRFIEENRFNLLIEDFKKYLDANSITYKDVIGNYYVGITQNEPYYLIANFTSKILVDGGADVILPCADNFNANQANIAALTPFISIDVYGQTNRRVAITSEYALSNAFLNYVKTESAIHILTSQNPSQPEIDNPEPNPIEDNTIVIACWGRFMKKDKFNALVEGFKDYLNANQIAYESVIGNFYDATVSSDPYYLVANFTSKIMQDGGADIILPCATNFNDNQSNIKALSFTPIDVYGQSNRQVLLIEENTLSQAFLAYIATDFAIELLASVD